ncbi:MAG: DUF2095 family protein [Candidatus Bathyarchaeia archaeon]
MEDKRFEKLFPNIAREMDSGKSLADVEFMGATVEGKGKWAGYEPDATDFIRRCNTREEAMEIIGYLEERGELTEERSASIKRQLEEEGLRSFGDKKKPGYYYDEEP